MATIDEVKSRLALAKVGVQMTQTALLLACNRQVTAEKLIETQRGELATARTKVADLQRAIDYREAFAAIDTPTT